MNETLQFVDRNFQLLVLEELMYFQKVIQPPFDTKSFISSYKGRDIDLDEEGYDVIPEILNHLLAIPIDKQWAELITDIGQDGGCPIWSAIIPNWDGESSDFIIDSAEDGRLFPNLKKITLFYNENRPAILDDFKEIGIQARWI